jgi:hypothetical protein
MRALLSRQSAHSASSIASALCCALVCACAGQTATAAPASAETEVRAQIAATTLRDAVVVDCQLPGRLQQLGGMRTYLTRGALLRLSAIDCRTRGGEYTVGDLSSGTLSLDRWLPLAEQGSLEAEYYVARIYANGMSGVTADYGKAAQWYQRAADKKYRPAMQELGYLYEQGLGVEQNQLLGINLQREASGLGEDLDYASKLTATKEEAARQIAALSDQLDSANAEVEQLRGQVAQADEKILQSSAELARERERLGELRSQLEQARRASANADPAHVKQLQDQLAAAERDLSSKQQALDALATSAGAQQSQLAVQLSTSQATNSQLNELLAAGKNENQSLRARLAQAEQRLIQSQQETAALRSDYLKEVAELSARDEELRQIRARGDDGGPALLAAKQREIDRQQQQLKALEEQIAPLRRQAAAAESGSSDAAARNKALESNLATLQARFNEQQQQLQTQRGELTRLESQSKDERAALLRQMSAQLSVQAGELEDKQRRIASLQLESSQLRSEFDRGRAQRGRDEAAAAGEMQRQRDAAQAAQEKVAERGAKLEQLEMESAAQQLQLVQERESLAQQVSVSQRAQQRVALLEADVHDKSEQVAEARRYISTLEQQLSSDRTPSTASTSQPPLVADNVSYRMPQSKDSDAITPSALLELVRSMGPANYHALIIGNGKYRHMPALSTPSNDARDISDLLKGRYGFEVNLLIDATNDQIMMAMNEYARTLTDADRLLIYYAGHGGTKTGPPERAFWLGVDADPELPSSWVSAQTISDTIWQIHARHVLLVADSCFSSVITHPTSTTVSRAIDERRIRIEWTRGARVVLTSGQNEPVVDGTSANRNHSLFAELFITVLRQNNILMSGEMLAHEVSSRIAAESARTGLKQSPTYSNLQDPNHKFGDFFFVPVTSGAQVASLAR